MPSERGAREVIAQNVAVEQDASRSRATGQLDERSKAGHEIESSRKQRALEPNHNGISASSEDEVETSPDIDVSDNLAFEQYQEQRAAMEQVGQILRGQAQHSVHALRTDIAQQASRLLEDSRVNFSGRSPSFAASALIPANDSVNLNASQNVDVSTRSERGILSRQVHVSEIV